MRVTVSMSLDGALLFLMRELALLYTINTTLDYLGGKY